ncbi:hypothetical protein D3C81_1076980 [compost metagenome]
MVAFKVEAHRAVFVSRERDEIAPRTQGCAAATEVVGAQGDAIDVGLDVDDHPRPASLMLAGQGHAPGTNH